MTTYKLLIESPKYDKYLKKIKTIAKKDKKKLVITGEDISFIADTNTRSYGGPDYKTITGSGAIITLL